MNSGFIIGKIGNKEIAKEEIRTFIERNKEVEWTTNSIYKGATLAEVKPVFSMNKNADDLLSKYNVGEIERMLIKDDKLSSYCDYMAELGEKDIRLIDKIAANREKIMGMTTTDTFSKSKTDVINHLKFNWKSTLLSSKELQSVLSPQIQNYLSKTINEY